MPVGVPNDTRVITADGSRTCVTNGSCADSRQRAHTAEVPVFSHATYHHAACSLSGGGPRVMGMYGQGAPLDCAPPPWHECASAAGCSFHASTRQACSSHSHARCGACGGVLSRQDSRLTACTGGSLSLPRRRWWEGGGGRVSRAPRSARPDPTRAHPAASRVGPYGHRRTRAPRSSPVVSCHAAGGFSPSCARAAIDGHVGFDSLVPCAPAMPLGEDGSGPAALPQGQPHPQSGYPAEVD